LCRRRHNRASDDAYVAGRDGCLNDGIAAVIDIISVIAAQADHAIGSTLPIEDVVAAVAGDDIADCVAGAVDGAVAGEIQVLRIA